MQFYSNTTVYPSNAFYSSIAFNHNTAFYSTTAVWERSGLVVEYLTLDQGVVG